MHGCFQAQSISVLAILLSFTCDALDCNPLLAQRAQRQSLDMSFPKLTQHRNVRWVCHVDDETKSEDSPCGILITAEAGVCVDVADKNVQWKENSALVLHARGTSENKNVMQHLCSVSAEGGVRQRRITEANHDCTDDSFTQPSEERLFIHPRKKSSGWQANSKLLGSVVSLFL